MFCSECGHNNKSGAVFCTECGKTLKKEEPQIEQVEESEGKKSLKIKSVRSAAPAVKGNDTVHETIYDEGQGETAPQKEAVSSVITEKFRVFGVIGDTFRLWGANLGKLVLMTLMSHAWMVAAFVLAFGIGVIKTPPNKDINPVTAFIFGGVCCIGLMVSYSACFAGMILVFDGYHKKGEQSLGAVEAFQKGFSYVLKVVGLSLLPVLFTGGFMIPQALAHDKNINDETVGFLFLIAIASSLYLWLRWLLILPTAVVESRWLGALTRSAELVRGKYWRIIGALILNWLIISLLIGFIVALESVWPLMIIAVIAAGLLLPPFIVAFYYAMYSEALRTHVEPLNNGISGATAYRRTIALKAITGFQSFGGMLLSILSVKLISNGNTEVIVMWVLIGFAICLLGFGIYYVKKWSWVTSIVTILVSLFFVLISLIEHSGGSGDQDAFFKIALGFFILLGIALVVKRKEFTSTSASC